MNPTRICTIDGCDKPIKARGWCATHYARWQRNGHVEATRSFHTGCSVQGCRNPHHAKGLCNSHYSVATYKPHPVERQPIIARFWSKVDKGDPSSCWTWKGAYFDDGYGAFKTRGMRLKNHRAHRFSLMLKLGREIRPGYWACHTCDNPGCVNPSHLYEGTPKDNARDCHERSRRPLGEQVERPRRKLSQEQVVTMREMAAQGASASTLARHFGIGSSTAHRIVTGQAWAHAPGPIRAATPRAGSPRPAPDQTAHPTTRGE